MGIPGWQDRTGERPAQAALRELHEEIGLELGESAIVGRLDDFVTDSGFVISPFVAITAPAPLCPNPDEVHAVHRIPLTRLAEDDVPHWITTPDGAEMLQMRLGPHWRVHAPTGAILYQFREVALFGRATRVADLLQPPFTREYRIRRDRPPAVVDGGTGPYSQRVHRRAEFPAAPGSRYVAAIGDVQHPTHRQGHRSRCSLVRRTRRHCDRP